MNTVDNDPFLRATKMIPGSAIPLPPPPPLLQKGSVVPVPAGLVSTPCIDVHNQKGGQLTQVRLKKVEKPKERESLLKEVSFDESKAKSIPLMTEKWDSEKESWVCDNLTLVEK